jgi:hypothetical protein
LGDIHETLVRILGTWMLGQYGKERRCAVMDYKKALISMIEEMENCDFLFKIYHYAIVKYRKERGAR